MQKNKNTSTLHYFYYHGTLVEKLKQQKVKGAAVHSPVHKFEIGSASDMKCLDACGA